MNSIITLRSYIDEDEERKIDLTNRTRIREILVVNLRALLLYSTCPVY